MAGGTSNDNKKFIAEASSLFVRLSPFGGTYSEEVLFYAGDPLPCFYKSIRKGMFDDPCLFGSASFSVGETHELFQSIRCSLMPANKMR